MAPKPEGQNSCRGGDYLEAVGVLFEDCEAVLDESSRPIKHPVVFKVENVPAQDGGKLTISPHTYEFRVQESRSIKVRISIKMNQRRNRACMCVRTGLERTSGRR